MCLKRTHCPFNPPIEFMFCLLVCFVVRNRNVTEDRTLMSIYFPTMNKGRDVHWHKKQSVYTLLLCVVYSLPFFLSPPFLSVPLFHVLYFCLFLYPALSSFLCPPFFPLFYFMLISLFFFSFSLVSSFFLRLWFPFSSVLFAQSFSLVSLSLDQSIRP